MSKEKNSQQNTSYTNLLQSQAHPDGIPFANQEQSEPYVVQPEDKEAVLLLEGLNDRQREAITSGLCSSMVLAGAGTGKTTTLTTRVAWLLMQQSRPDWRGDQSGILALTFTNRAADSMRQRLRDLVGLSSNKVSISTFHSMAWQFLRVDPEFSDKPWSIISQTGQENIIRQWRSEYKEQQEKRMNNHVIEDLLRKNPDWTVDDISSEAFKLAKNELKKEINEFFRNGPSVRVSLNFIVRMKEYEIDIDKLEEVQEATEGLTSERSPMMSEERCLILIEMFRFYQSELKRLYKMDFQDILLEYRNLLKSSRTSREHAFKQFGYILLDEMQDTDPLQYEILQWMTRDHQWLREHPDSHPTVVLAVGDDDQSIYSFRNATPEIMQAFAEHYHAKMHVLVENYRSLPHILEASNSLIANNIDRIGKDLIPMKRVKDEKPDDLKVRCRVCDSPWDEADMVVKEIQDLLKKDCLPGDIAVLSRTKRQLSPIENRMLKKGIQFRNFCGYNFFKRKEIKQALTWLTAVGRPDDINVMDALTGFELEGISEHYIQGMVKEARKKGISLTEEIAIISKDWFECETAYVKTNTQIEFYDNLIQEERRKPADTRSDEIIKKARKERDHLTAFLRELNQQYPQFRMERMRKAAKSLKLFNSWLFVAREQVLVPADSLGNQLNNHLPILIEEVLNAAYFLDWIDAQKEDDSEDQYETEEERKEQRKMRVESLPSMARGFIERVIEEDNRQILDAPLQDIYMEFIQDCHLNGNPKETNANYVTLNTIHGAKGLEYDHVFVIGMNDGKLPLIGSVKEGQPNDSGEEDEEGLEGGASDDNSLDNKKKAIQENKNGLTVALFAECPKEDLEEDCALENAVLREERRLAYVAFTRAAKTLHLSYYETQNEKQTKEKLPPSRFFSEFSDKLKKTERIESAFRARYKNMGPMPKILVQPRI